MSLQLVQVQCPYCWEFFELEVEDLGEAQTYIQDCTVCCRPIQFDVSPGDGEPEVTASRSDS